jgi:HEAT repeat protein
METEEEVMKRRAAANWLMLGCALALGCSRKPPYEGRSVAELEKMLTDPVPTVRIQGAYGLGLHGSDSRPAVPALAQALQSPDGLLRTQAALALGKIGPDARAAVPQLIVALDDPEWSVRRQTVVTLGQIGPDAHSAAPTLRRLQHDDPNGLVRKAVEQALPKVSG